MSTEMPELPDLPLDRPHRLDLLIRFALGVTFAFSAGVCIRGGIENLMDLDLINPQPGQFGQALSGFAIGIYTLMIACLYVVRFKRIDKASGALPCAAAILGGFLMSALLLLNPRDDLPLWAQIAASLLVVVGNGFAILTLLRLGRSFSILPESRKLVTHGPYAVVRHPLYLAEAVATLGAVIHFLSVEALLLVAFQLALQIIRIHYEEKVLKETFPEYDDYAKRTWRLIPGIY